ncbi:hypothetical protein BDN70DRAFT_705630 [Pholiota conissans]|uniref:Uncharacterized protein n=1 Tax=Pholiota conissans TaxID=109636 RepID=A0A9P6D6U2_9AGAR|nr:hypothetical protein BDN70DRAFT_705630 [Pholiota conissans]
MSKNEFIDPKLVVCAAPWMLLCAYDTGLGHWVSLQPILAEWPTPVMPPLQIQESEVPPAAKHVCSEPQPDKENVAFQDGPRSYAASRFRISYYGGRTASFRGFVAPKIPSLSRPVRFNRMKPEQAYEFSKSFKNSQQAAQRGRGKKVAFVLPGEHEETRKPLRCLPLSPRSRRLNLHTDIPTSRPDVVSSPVEWPWNIRWIRPIAGFFGWA